MDLWQKLLIATFCLINLLFFIKSLYEIIKKKNPFGLTGNLFFIGAFVWGDVFVLGPFWILISVISIIANNWSLFLLFVSVFWVIRSLGEVIYWLNEQFADKNHNPPEKLMFNKIIDGPAIWFIYQLFWQCFFVFSIIISVYFCRIWLESL